MWDKVLNAEEDFVVSYEIEDDGSDNWKIRSYEPDSVSDDTHHGDFGAV